MLGRVIVLNSLVGSLFVHKMNVLPTLPKQWRKFIEKTITNFLWDGKTAKISYNKLTARKEQGGLKLFNVKHKESSLKIQWVKIYYENVEIKCLANSMIRFDLGEKVMGSQSYGNGYSVVC